MQVRGGQRKAFTLVETTLYIALVSLVVLALVYFLLAISQARLKATVISQVQDSERFIFSQLKTVVAGAASINWSASELGELSGSLVLLDKNGQAETIKINEAGRVVLVVGGLETELSKSTIVIKELSFSRADDRTVQVKLSLKYLDEAQDSSLNYQAEWQSALAIAN